MTNQLESFKKKFGRDPAPGDPIFFDLDADTLQPFSDEAIEALEQQAVSIIASILWRRSALIPC